MRIGALAARLLLASVLLAGGFTKAVGPAAEFAGALAAYKLFPIAWVTPIARVVPWIELLTGTYLFFGFYTRFFAKVAAGLFFCFIATLASALLRHIDLASCGCFGAVHVSPRLTLALDAVGLSLSCLLVRMEPARPAVDFWL